MIEQCSSCRKSHETGDREPYDGVPVKECPHLNAYPHYIYPQWAAKSMYQLGYCDAIHVLPLDLSENYYREKQK